MVKKNFQVTEGTIDLLRALTTRYGKKADGLMITAGLLRLKSLSHDELARAVADAFVLPELGYVFGLLIVLWIVLLFAGMFVK